MSNLANSANLLFLSAKKFCKSLNIINNKNYMCKKKSTNKIREAPNRL